MNKLRLQWKLIVGIAAVVFFLALGAILYVSHNQRQPAPKKDDNVIRHSTDEPDESKQNADAYQWKGEAGDPKHISIPTIGMESLIQRVGVDQRKQIAVPTNIHLVGWFTDSARPGAPGLSIIDGHVSGRAQDGIFKNLNKLNVNDTFTVTQGDGKQLQYKVIGKVSVPTADATNEIFSQNPAVKSQLNLVTCTGTYDDAQRGYTDRLIIQAELVS